ncbi:hypothetical protein LCGC14_2890940, partial [marine sediment metagenome]
AGQIALEVRDLLEGLEQKLEEKVYELISKTCGELEDLACEVGSRNDELQDRDDQ